MTIGAAGHRPPLFPSLRYSPDSSLVEYVNTLTLLVVLGIAVRSDMLAHRIPNALTALAACAGLLLQALQAGSPGLLMSLAGIAVGAGFMLPFYALRGMGAGDVKLMGAIGSFLGPKTVLLVAGATLVIGAAFGIARLLTYLSARLNLSQRPVLPELEPATAVTFSAVRKEKFPYAIAIACGGLVGLFHNGQLAALAALITQ